MADCTAYEYELEDGRRLFMSDRTKETLDSSLFMTGHGELKVLEAVLNFERVLFQKTCKNVAEWMDSSAGATIVVPSDWNNLSADGASNAIGAVAEYEVVTRDGRPSSVDFDTCFAHQNQRSALRSSGVVTFKTGPTNKDLGNCLNKSHEIQVRIYRSPNRMTVLNAIQTEKGRDPHMGPKLRTDTRWDSSYDETKRANQIMGDICDTLTALLDVGGDDRHLLTASEIESNDYGGLTYTQEDKKILRQYEGVSLPSRNYSKFLQDRNNTPSYVLFESRMAIQDTLAEYFVIHPGE